MSLQHDNHYVPCLYLKRFATSPGRIWTYRILAAHSRVPLWKRAAIKGVAYHAHLYTRIAAGAQTDEIEKWLNTDFETPAEEALMKATTDMKLTPADWRRLVRFAAAQDVRTPARLSEHLERWNKTVPDLLENTLRNSVHELEKAKRSGQPLERRKVANSEYIPLRVTTEIEPGEKVGRLKGELVVGRSMWFFAIRHALMKTVDVLHNHRWSLLIPPDDLAWFTSDDPVIRLNYYEKGKYDFGGGWGSRGTEIFLPLSPRHLLYTKIGESTHHRERLLPRAEARMIRRFIAEHAHRFIFAASVDEEVPILHPRTVDAAALRHEDEQWRKWPENQTNAEQELMNSRNTRV